METASSSKKPLITILRIFVDSAVNTSNYISKANIIREVPGSAYVVG